VINGVDPARILMLTFTPGGAEMRRRAHEITRRALDDALGGVSQGILAAPTMIGTFIRSATGCCAATRRTCSRPALQRIDRGDSADLMDSLRQELGLAARRKRFRARIPACRSSPTVSTRARGLTGLWVHYPWCAQWEADLANLFAPTSNRAALEPARLRRPAALLAR
jgi:DNA helicase-2/ATP-dependent DNA helicase PcrA